MINLEHTADHNPAVERNFDLLRSLVVDTGGTSVALRFGTATLTYTAAAVSAATTVAHNLGTTPEFIGSIGTAGTKRHIVNYVSSTRTTTGFDLISETADGAAMSGSISVFWLAIG